MWQPFLNDAEPVATGAFEFTSDLPSRSHAGDATLPGHLRLQPQRSPARSWLERECPCYGFLVSEPSRLAARSPAPGFSVGRTGPGLYSSALAASALWMNLRRSGSFGRRCESQGNEASLVCGSDQLPSQTDARDFLPIGDVPFEWLFPQMAAVVHSGGAGSSAAGMRAGVPNITVPFFSDQPFWARRVAAVGAGPAPIPQKELTAERLAAAITASIQDPSIRKNAAVVGEKIRAENGVERAIEIITRHLTAVRPGISPR